ncbi:type IX secretion system ring subunit PorN/GldN [Nonlabens xiamenensis]|uniref:type IX secretion system ring protein PorN/GldN n=1 Tax=Nonlabens xiamenensis TaxID=2341043 RepID=UPI000F60A1F3|nr:gliding motility protein GldN [Nonlabens xiamenensis]
MNKIIVLLAALLLSGVSMAQNNILNAKDPSEFGKKTESQMENDNDKPLPYGHVGDRDILWQRTTWETIDLDERVNFPLYYPVDTNFVGKERRSLFHVLSAAARSGDLTLYGDSYFNEAREFEDVEPTLKSQKITNAGIDILNENGIFVEEGVKPLDIDTTYNLPGFDEYIETNTIGADDVKEYRIRGLWYFDTRQSELRYRLIGICPVTPDVNFPDDPTGVELFWVYYPDARELLHNAHAFNTLNSARPISFDHMLNSRRFNAVIYKMDNVQGDREVKRYIADNSMMQLLESERLKEIIRNFEIDQWNY